MIIIGVNYNHLLNYCFIINPAMPSAAFFQGQISSIRSGPQIDFPLKCFELKPLV